MSTSILYHGFGLKGHRHKKTEFVEGEIRFHIGLKPRHLRCPLCNTRQVIKHSEKLRTLRTLPIGKKLVKLVVSVPRVECPYCEVRRRVKLPSTEKRLSYTKQFARYVIGLCEVMTIRAVARHLGVSWDLVKDIHKKYLQKHFSKPRLSHLKQIAIDEISIGDNHKYLTVVLDLATGAVVYVGKGKGTDALKDFWTRLGRAHAQIEAVAIDMSPAYISAVLDNLPEAQLVFDRFHIAKLFNDKITELRRDLQREADENEKEVFKGLRWLLVKHPENIDEDEDKKRRLQEALKINQPLALVYYMKDEFRQFWEQKDKEAAKHFLHDWTGRAVASEVSVLKKLGKTIQAHRSGLLAWYDYPISTSPLEGVNNKIKTLQRQAYGYRDKEYFRLRIFSCHRADYKVVG